MWDKNAKPDFRSYIQTHVVVGDGAMATLLHQNGIPVRTCYEELCLTHPVWVEDVHKAYIAAGANLIQTNTFSAHRAGLSRYGLEDSVGVINQTAAQIALRAADGQAFVFGTVGSILGLRPHEFLLSAERRSELAAQFEEQVKALVQEPIDGILLETFADVSEMLVAIDTVRKVTALPIIANLSPETASVTRDGERIERAFERMEAAGADVVGLNCRLGPSGILRSYEGLPKSGAHLYGAVPNAGLLQVVDGDYSFTGSTKYFADIAAQLLERGVRFLGGCCGTTPEHIRNLADRVLNHSAVGPNHAPVLPGKAHTQAESDRFASGSTGASTAEAAKAIDAATPTPTEHLGHVVPRVGETIVDRVRNKVTVIVELDPPRTLDIGRYLTGAAHLHEAGADFITLADNSLGTVRVSNMALAALLKDKGIEPLVHVACRDRNLIGQQSHLMGLNVLDIHHILLVTGDPSKFGDLPGATSVFDVSSTELTKMVKRLNAGLAFSGQTLKHPSQFVVGTSFNPHVLNFDKAIERLKRKVEAGADYVMTQPVFDQAMFERIHRATKDLAAPMFVGVMPLVSDRNAKFLHNEVPGIQIPDDIMQRMQNAPSEEAYAEGLSIAKELIDEALNYFNGIYLVTPFLRYELTEHLTAYIRSQEAKRLVASADHSA